MAWVYNPTIRDSALSQLYTHWQREQYVQDITQNAELQSNRIIQNIKNSANDISSAVYKSALYLAGSIDRLEETIKTEIRASTDAIVNEITELKDVIDFKLSIIIKQNEITNYYLKEINSWIQLSDEQKARMIDIHEGLQFLNIALSEGQNSEWWEAALNYFNNAITLKKDDYFTHQQIAFVYYCSNNHRNLEKALYHFNESARFTYVYYKSGGTNLSSVNPQNGSYQDFLIETYFQAANTCYWMQDQDPIYLNKAVDYIDKILLLQSQNSKALFFKAKYLSKIGESLQASRLIEDAIMIKNQIWIETIDDEDLMSNPEIINTLGKIKLTVVNQLTKIINEISLYDYKQTAANAVICDCLNYLRSDNYFEIVTGIKLLENKVNREFTIFKYTNRSETLSTKDLYIKARTDFDATDKEFIRQMYYTYISYNGIGREFIAGGTYTELWTDKIISVKIWLPIQDYKLQIEEMDVITYLKEYFRIYNQNKTIVTPIIDAIKFKLNQTSFFGGLALNNDETKRALWFINYYEKLLENV